MSNSSANGADSFRHFADSIKGQGRFHMESSHGEFLQQLISSTKDRTIEMNRGMDLWRAQIGCVVDHDYEDPATGESVTARIPFGIDRMKPKPNCAVEGRANPKGIPYLYCATSMDTAVGEVRPYVGDFVSVAKLDTLRDLRLANCSDYEPRFHGTYPLSEMWADINCAFSEPITNTDSVADYAPTQALAEVFRKNHFDGVMYSSRHGSGLSVVLFDVKAIRFRNLMLHEVRKIVLECGCVFKLCL